MEQDKTIEKPRFRRNPPGFRGYWRNPWLLRILTFGHNPADPDMPVPLFPPISYFPLFKRLNS
jgi:hypothetical protein